MDISLTGHWGVSVDNISADMMIENINIWKEIWLLKSATLNIKDNGMDWLVLTSKL